MHQLVDLQPSECNQASFSFHSHGELADGSQLCRKVLSNRGTIHGSMQNHEDDGKPNNYGSMPFLACAVLSVCCTQCMQYSVYTVLGEYCTQ
jgi:hypothetical protein